jgi:LysM repeat protein
MKSKRGCLYITGGLALAAVLILLGLAGMQILRGLGPSAGAERTPPIVQITSPENGVSAQAGSYLPVSAAIFFSPKLPVQTIEWWLDGVLLGNEAVEPEEGATQFYAQYDLLVPDSGVHLLFLRAIDSEGLIGQSMPLFIQGEEKGEAFHLVEVGEGDTLESIASEYSSDVSTLENLNPGLDGGTPKPGNSIKVPVPPEQGAVPAAPPAPAQSGDVVLAPSNQMLQPGDLAPGLSGLLAAAIPKAPANLQAQVKDCKVRLVWDDRAANETGYEIWMTSPGVPPIKLVTLQASPGGSTWYEFDAPGPGFFIFWVVAVNSGGGQPSNFAPVTAAQTCPSGGAANLQIEIKDINLKSAADKVYCYVSAENAPEVRLPAQDGNFITVQAGHGDLTPWPHTYAVPFPQDGMLDLSGECLGWSGKDLNKLGKFTASLGSEKWDGMERQILADNFDINLAVLPQNAQGSGGVTYTSGPSLPIPYNLKDEPDSDDPRSRRLTWKWDGNIKELSFFKIFLNGVPYGGLNWFSYANVFSSDNNYESIIKVNHACGQDLKWQVAAVYGPNISALSAPYEVHLLPCENVARVRFLYLDLYCAAEGGSDCLANNQNCDTLDGYYQLKVNDEMRSFWGGDFFMPMRCGRYYFNQIGSSYEANKIYPSADSFIIPVNADGIDLQIRASVWDHDSTSGDDGIANMSRNLWFPSVENALNSLKGNSTEDDCAWVEETGIDWGDGTAISQFTYSVEIFPNACQDAP